MSIPSHRGSVPLPVTHSVAKALHAGLPADAGSLQVAVYNTSVLHSLALRALGVAVAATDEAVSMPSGEALICRVQSESNVQPTENEGLVPFSLHKVLRALFICAEGMEEWAWPACWCDSPTSESSTTRAYMLYTMLLLYYVICMTFWLLVALFWCCDFGLHYHQQLTDHHQALVRHLCLDAP